MLRLHSLIRLISVFLVVTAVFMSASITTLLPLYAVVLMAVLMSRVSANHLRFVVFITTPLLIALLLVWGWLIDARQVPTSHQSGIHYAFFMWLRVVACGGMLQCLFIPLIEQPAYLKVFLERIGAGVALSTLMLSSITFLPEIRRRVNRITDARRAQGHSLSGLKGLRELPALLMPLVSSLLDSSVQRAELLSHRGILERNQSASREITYSIPQSVLALVVALSIVITTSFVRFYA
jgi:energy-coupling factor transporter transmembrane protein EcfT